MKRLLFLAAVLSSVAGAGPVLAASSGTLVVCDDVRDPMTLDPQREFSEKNHTVVQQMFEGLVRFAPDGAIIPALAVSWERMDPLRMRFKLRPGVVFHNGRPFDAESVKFSVSRYLDPKTGFPAAGFLSTLDGVEVVDDLTVDVVTKSPDGLLLNRLAGFVVMVEPEYYRGGDEEALRRRPVGTGPFAFESWTEGRSVRLKAFRSYWNKSLPKLGALEFRFIPLESQVEALLGGDVDVLTSLPGTRTLEVQASTAARVVKAATFYTVAGNFNTARPPLSDFRVRKAINLAVDRQALVRYDIFGNGGAIGTLTLPGEDGHDESIKPYPYSPRTAKRLLAEAGYPEGFALKVLLKANAERTGKILQTQLAKVGVALETTLVTDAELFTFLHDRSRWDIAIYDVPDPMHHANFIRSIFLASASPFSLAASPEVDAGLAKVASELDPAKRAAASKALDRLIHEKHLALPTYQRLRTYGVRRGIAFSPYRSGMPYFYDATKKVP